MLSQNGWELATQKIEWDKTCRDRKKSGLSISNPPLEDPLDLHLIPHQDSTTLQPKFLSSEDPEVQYRIVPNWLLLGQYRLEDDTTILNCLP